MTGQVLRPPLRDRRFWVIQVVILAVAVGHLLLDLHKSWLPAGIPDYPTVGLFLLPVIYAALRFGMGGACASAAWGTILMMPDLFVVDSRADLWSDGTLLVMICLVAVAVGQRVEREKIARQRADLAIRAHTAAEARFRALFEASSAPTLVTDKSGALREANPAAKALFGARLGRRQLADLVGNGVSRRLLAQTPPKLLSVVLPDGTGRVLHPLSTLVTDSGDDPLLQIILQDVTEDEKRQRDTESFALQVVHVQEQERRRIGQDIHDEPLQTLIYLSRRLEALADDGEVLAAHREALASIREILVGVVIQLRQLADGLRPPVLDDIGVVASLRQLVAEFSGRSETKASLHVSGPELDLGWDQKTDIYRIVQEALRNVERHAGASKVALHLSFAKRTVRVKVQDDGCGFVVATTVPGLGLRGMRERATLSKGRLEVTSAPGQGTTVRLTMTVAAATGPSEEAARAAPGGQGGLRNSSRGPAGATRRPTQMGLVVEGGPRSGSRLAPEPGRELAPAALTGLGSGAAPG